MRIKDNPDFIRSPEGAVLNTNREKLMKARKKIREEKERLEYIYSLEERIRKLEEKLNVD